MKKKKNKPMPQSGMQAEKQTNASKQNASRKTNQCLKAECKQKNKSSKYGISNHEYGSADGYVLTCLYFGSESIYETGGYCR